MVELIMTAETVSASPENPLVATYHDPCHASRGQGLTKEPREILNNIEGIEYREMPEADWCCGGAGSYALSHYDLSQRVLDRKMENLKKTDADLLVTSCPACMIQLAYGVRRHNLNIRVCHISQVVAGLGR
jgi:glycolate oxidase iron-sulfur subunit